MSREAMISGAIGGVFGGVAFGALMGMTGMLPMVAKLVGSSSPAVGFLLHLIISVVIGVGYSVLVDDRVARPGPVIAAGTGYGILWWVLGPLTLMPFFLGMGLGVNWSLEAARSMLPSLYGHLLYGLLLAVAYTYMGRRLGLLCRC